MGELLNLAVYNPAILSDEDFLAGFVARGELVEALLGELRRSGPAEAAPHRIVVGQRGMGKSSMLRRLALGIERDPELAARILPLTFREEQYNVTNLHKLWLNCLDALADRLERKGEVAEVERLDREIARLTPVHDDPEGNAALAALKEAAVRQGRRLLLLLDNIDLIFDGLDGHDWTLRRVLQERGGIMVIGAAATLMEATADVGKPFYDFFRITLLERLDAREFSACLRRIAGRRGEPGRRVIEVLDRDPARIHALNDLTGGNPRTLVLLYMLLEMDPGEDVMGDLERLLDQVSVLYKARVEDLAPQARAVLDAIALHWDPVTADATARTTGLKVTTVTSQIDRLRKFGIVEKVTLSRPSPTGYQVSERFFNIWYLMRHASRHQRGRLRWLTRFLRDFYSPPQLARMASELLGGEGGAGQGRGLYALALGQAVEEPGLRHLLNHYATRELDRFAAETRARLEEIVSLEELDQDTLEMAELERRVLACERDWGETSAEAFWAGLGGALYLSRQEKQGIVSELGELDGEQVTDMVRIFREEPEDLLRLFPFPESLERVQEALRRGGMRELGDVEHAVALARHYDDPKVLLFLDRPDAGWSGEALEMLEEAYRQAIELAPENASIWNSFGNLLQYRLGRYPEAEEAYRRAIELDPEHAYPWYNLGNLLQVHLGRYPEAEEAYRRAIELDPEYVYSWNNLGNLLQVHLGRYPEAEEAYRRAIGLDPEHAYPWINLGNLLKNHLGRYPEAEEAYRRAIDIDPKWSSPWYNLGNLLQDHLARYPEAEEAYRRAIELDPKTPIPVGNLAYALLSDPNRRTEAESLYAEATSRLPAHGAALLHAFHALAYENFGEATRLLGGVLEEGHRELFTDYWDDLLRNLRLAHRLGYGERLLAWLDGSGLADRYLPLRAAYDAYLHGEERLRDVNPEVGGAARSIHAWLASDGSAGTASGKGRKGRGR